MKENFDKLDTKIESVRTELKGEIGEVKKDTNSRMDRIEDRMDRLETGQRNIVNEVASVKNNESKFSLDIARWLFARSTERKSEEVLP
jgi:predicted  nucleic acid-binding Zn-ribbon protein